MNSKAHNIYMEAALEQAKLAYANGEVPVGAVIVQQDKIIARSYNQVEINHDASSHAELLAIREAGKSFSNWRLNDADLYVTLEPCVMCIGAILQSRIKNLYFGAYDKKAGAVGSLFDLSNHPGIGRSVHVFPELMAEESQQLLELFFKQRRG
ncbi:nucleoside deaminase [bacterium]|nr:nucleoside deaminase [bacterium]